MNTKYNFKAHIFPGIELSWDEQTYIRDKPKKYLLETIKLINKHDMKVIVEIGAARQKMEHNINALCLKEQRDLEEAGYPIPEALKTDCHCNDGHGSYFWAFYTDCEIITCDIDETLVKLFKEDERLKNIKFVLDDGINFLNNFSRKKKIDFLFLDAWDVVPNTEYAEKHLESYLSIRDNLSDKSLILIDDTDVGGEYGGKGKLLIPYLLQDGWKEIFTGRQSLYANFDV
jgi:hypothetical protein